MVYAVFVSQLKANLVRGGGIYITVVRYACRYSDTMLLPRDVFLHANKTHKLLSPPLLHLSAQQSKTWPYNGKVQQITKGLQFVSPDCL